MMKIIANGTGKPEGKTEGFGCGEKPHDERERKHNEKNIKSVPEDSRWVERPVTSPDNTSDCTVVHCNKAVSRMLMEVNNGN